jgi:hypothetical protein
MTTPDDEPIPDMTGPMANWPFMLDFIDAVIARFSESQPGLQADFEAVREEVADGVKPMHEALAKPFALRLPGSIGAPAQAEITQAATESVYNLVRGLIAERIAREITIAVRRRLDSRQ